MTPKDIRKALIDAETTAAAIGRRLGVTRGAVYHVIAGRKRTPRIRAAIAEAIGMSVSEVWGSPGEQAQVEPVTMYTTKVGQ